MPYTPPPDYIPPPDAKASGYIPPPDYIQPPDAVSDKVPKAEYDWSQLGAQTKKELPGYLFLPNGVTVNQNNNKVWVPSQRQWFTPNEEGAISPDSGSIINPSSDIMRDELASANEVGRHLVKPVQSPSPSVVNAPMMASHAPTTQPTATDIGVAKRSMNYLFGSDKSLGLGDLDLRAMAGNLVASGESTVSGITGYMAKRFDDLSKVLGNTMPLIGIARLVAKEISPKLDNDAAAKKVLEHVSDYTGAMAQQARGWAPQGYQPGIAGKIEQMGAPLAASIANPIAGSAAFGMPMGNEAEEAAKAAGASVPAQKLMGVAGSVAGGITGLFGTGSGAMGGVAPTIAERLASSGQAAGLGGAVTAGMNALEKLVYNPDKKVLEGVSDNALMMGIVGFAHASGNPVTEEEAARLAKFAREDPRGFAKKYKSVVAPIIERVSPQAPPERTPDMIRQEALMALRRGDTERASALADELKRATAPKPATHPAFREATPEEAARVGKYDPLTASDITPEVEQAAQEAMRPGGGTTVTEPTRPVQAKETARGGVQTGNENGNWVWDSDLDMWKWMARPWEAGDILVNGNGRWRFKGTYSNVAGFEMPDVEWLGEGDPPLFRLPDFELEGDKPPMPTTAPSEMQAPVSVGDIVPTDTHGTTYIGPDGEQVASPADTITGTMQPQVVMPTDGNANLVQFNLSQDQPKRDYGYPEHLKDAALTAHTFTPEQIESAISDLKKHAIDQVNNLQSVGKEDKIRLISALKSENMSRFEKISDKLDLSTEDEDAMSLSGMGGNPLLLEDAIRLRNHIQNDYFSDLSTPELEQSIGAHLFAHASHGIGSDPVATRSMVDAFNEYAKRGKTLDDLKNAIGSQAVRRGLTGEELSAMLDRFKVAAAKSGIQLDLGGQNAIGMTPGGSGTTHLSNEEIQRSQRGDRYYRVDRTGRITNLGPQPDAPVRNGEAIIMVSGRTGEPQVQNSQGLGNDSAVLSRFGNKVMQVHEQGRGMTGNLYSGLDIFKTLRNIAEAAKRELGLPEGATDAELAREVMGRIGKLGSSVNETAAKIMANIKGINRDMAQALAEHLHRAVSGTRQGHPEAVGRDIKPKARDFLTPEQIEAEKADRAKYKDLLQTLIPGDSPEAKAERAKMWKNYEAPWKRELPPEETPTKPSLPYRPATRAREGSIPDAINQFLDQTLRRAFPTAVDQAGARAGDISRYRESEAATAIFKVNRNIRNALVKMSMAKPEIREMVADAIESLAGKYKINDAKLAKSVDFVKAQSKELGAELVRVGAIKSYLENYLRHAFKESPEQIELAIKKKSPTGDLGYLIERHGPDTYAIAKELGLTPKNTNPFQTFFDDFVNKQKFLVAHKTISDLMGEGLVTKDAQPGYVKLNDYLRNAVSKSKAGEAGEYYAPKSVADLLNNHLGEGFERNIGFRAIRAFNNSMNHVQLGLSFFHGMFIMRDMANTMLGSGITAMARGDFREGARQLALGASPIYGQKVMASSGSEMRSMMAGETPTTPEMQQVIHAYQLGGGHPELSPEYINDSMLKMRESWAKAKDVKLDAASRAYWGVKTVGEIPFSALEQFAKPVMEHLVPNAKAGAFRELWKVESKRLPPDATDAQKAVVARKLVNDIDDRMGQLIYNNLHLPNAMRQAITLTIRAGGWDIGSLRAIYGSGIDFAKAGKMLAQDVAAKAGAIKPETMESIKAKREAQGVFGPKSYMTQRMGYGVASALSMAVTNGLITYVGNRVRNATKGPGEKDTETKPTGMDFVFPRIGKDRYSVAGYEKEAVEQYHILKNVLLHHDPSAITDYISQKASPVVNLAEMWGSGYDWKGNRIGKLSALGQQYNPMVTKDMGSTELPTSSAAIGRLGGPNPIQNAGRFIGITPAPKKLTQTDAENKALDILHQDKTPLTEQAADHADFVNRMALYYKNGDMEVYNDAKNRGLLTPRDVATIKKKARETDLLTGVVGSRSVSPEDALDIYKNFASQDEQKKLHSVMLRKKSLARRRTPEADMAQYRKDWSVVK